MTKPEFDRPPVKNWETDWDHLDSAWQEDPYPILEGLRARCPVAHTERFTGAYLFTRYADVKAAAHDTATFSSRRVVLRDYRPEPPPSNPPITEDPPRHKGLKQVLLAPFGIEAVSKLEPVTRAFCRTLIAQFIQDGACDAAQQYARRIPVRVTANLLGVSDEDSDLFVLWIHQILERGIRDDAALRQGVGAMTQYFKLHVEQRRGQGGDDLISIVARATVDGVPLTEGAVLGMLRLILMAGVDTTWSAIGASLWHLARNPADRRRLCREPELMTTAVEELLRAYAPVTIAREVVQDAVVSGCPIEAGSLAMLSFPSANRDPEVFEQPDVVQLDRQVNPHLAFGVGIHRCVGANLARMQLRVALEEWLAQIPEFELAPGALVEWSEGTVRGPRRLPLTLGTAG